MNQRQVLALRRLHRIIAFLTAFPFEDARGKRLTRELTETVDALDHLQASQRVSQVDVRTNAIAGAQLRRALRNGHLLPIRRNAVIALHGVAGVERALVVPHATAKGPTLVDAAERMATALRPYARYLKSQGFAPGFLADLRRAALDVKRWEAAVPKKLNVQKGTTAALRRRFTAASALVRALEGLVMARAVREPSLWRFWLSARKQPAKTGRPRGSRNSERLPDPAR